MDHKLTIENHLLNIIQKINQNCTPWYIEAHASEAAENYHET